MKTIKLIFVLLAGLALGACSSDDDNGNSGNGNNNGTNTGYTENVPDVAPVWQVDWSHNQERPELAEPDYASIYEHWTSLKVQIEDELMPYGHLRQRRTARADRSGRRRRQQ